MGHFEFSVGVGGQGAIPKSYRLDFTHTWAHLAQRVCETNKISPGSFIRLTHTFDDERSLMPGDDAQLMMNSYVVPSPDAWTGVPIPKAGLPGVVVHINKQQKVCQVQWANNKVSKKCKIIGANDSNHKNMQLLCVLPHTLELDLSPFEYGAWEPDASIIVEVATVHRPQFTRVSSIKPEFSSPPEYPRTYLNGYGPRLAFQTDDEGDAGTSGDEVDFDIHGRSPRSPACTDTQKRTATNGSVPAKRPKHAIPPPPAPIHPPMSPDNQNGRLTSMASGAVASTAPVSTTAAKKIYAHSGPPAPAPAVTKDMPTPAALLAAANTRKAIGDWMGADHLSKWMMDQPGAVTRLAAPYIISCKITGGMMLKWLREPPTDCRTDIPQQLDSVTLRSIRLAAQKYDSTIPDSPAWQCGCSAHLDSIYNDPPIHLGTYADVGKKVKIGRHSDSDYQLAWKDRHREVYMTISRIHCEIVLTQHGWTACDNSENGTFVNDDLVEGGKGRLLRPGDIVSLGPPAKENNRSRGYRFKFMDLAG